LSNDVNFSFDVTNGESCQLVANLAKISGGAKILYSIYIYNIFVTNSVKINT